MKLIEKSLIFILFLKFIMLADSAPLDKFNGNISYPFGSQSSNVVIHQDSLSGNNIKSWFFNVGIFNQDKRLPDHPGFEWPKGTGHHACFTAGLSMGCYVNGQLREAMCSYAGEYAPGYVDNSSGTPVAVTNGNFKMYLVKGIIQPTNPDYMNWGLMVPYGAPFVDKNGNGVFDPGIDIAGQKDASTTLFICMTDGFPGEHKVGEGFGGGTLPMYSEIHLTAWCYDSPGLGDMQFINFVVINRNVVNWERTYMGITVDPDLGWANDDYIGCDTTLNMGFCYNGDDDDAGNSYAYGPHPPAFGMDYFTSPVNKSVNPPDTLGLTSFVYFTNTSTPGPACEKDPNGEALPAYYMLKGLKKDQTPWVIPNSGSRTTKFCYPGDPETGQGWTEGSPGTPSGSVQNCNGSLEGTVISVNPVGDRRFIFNSGAEDFVIRPNIDTQNIVLAQFVARGTNNLNSVTQLKRRDKIAQKIFDAHFNVIPPPPPPEITTSFKEVSSRGNLALTLSWGDISESYKFQDTLFANSSDSSFYQFEGYEVYEVKRSAPTVPDVFKPDEPNRNDIKLLAIYDIRDTVGIIVDTFSTGEGPGGQEQFGVFPVVPPYTIGAPAGFPNSGINRHITITKTLFPEEHGGNTDLIYGNTYKFVVVAYAYNTHSLGKGSSIIRNSLDSRLLVITPESNLAGSQFNYHDGDTLNTSRRDLGVIPIVEAQELVKNAKYRIVFNNPDTTYNLLRSFNNGGSFDVLKTNLKFTPQTRYVDDSSRIFDGILFKVNKIRWIALGGGNFTGNVGVIQDITTNQKPDSIQARYPGWDYNPPANRNVEGSKYLRIITKPWQSKSMALSYPTRNTYIGQRSLVDPEGLRKVQLKFTGYGSGQMAYRFLAVDSVTYKFQDMREIPMKAFEIETTDSTSGPRQLNCAFLEFPGSTQNNKWEPTSDTLGGKEILYIFNSNYSSTPDPFYSDTTNNMFFQQSQYDIMYVWSAKLINPGSVFKPNDELIIYPYSVTRPEITDGFPLYYDIDTKMPLIGNTEIASVNNDLDNIRVVPNPYYGFNALETSNSGRFITFRRLPKQVTIKIFTLNGDMIKSLEKNDNNSTLQWNMTNVENVPVASGMYLAIVDAPGIGQKVLKIAILTPEERIDF